MTKREITALVFAAALGVLFVARFTNWFRAPQMVILPAPARRLVADGKTTTPQPAFDLVQKQKLTRVKVVPLTNGKFSNPTPAVWHLISKSNSVPVKGFVYGSSIPGMQLASTNVPARPLKPGQQYHLIVEAGKLKGEMDFQAVAADAPTTE
jgi:hypothetical protein